jgi:hydrophobe/amphiphile efflux-1 (HAE1) family protein
MIRGALRNPIGVLMACLALLLLGGVAVQRIPVDLFPSISVPVIIVGTSMPGASPQTVEQNVTVPIERAVAQAWNLAYITSSSRQGLSIVQAWFRWGTDINAALLDVQQQVQAVSDSLPETARAPLTVKFDLSSLPVAFVTIKGGGQDERALYDLAFNVVAPQLVSIPGVAAATTQGGRVRQINVDVDPNLLRQKGLSLLDIDRAIRKANVVFPTGSLRSGRMEYDVFTNSQIQSVKELEEVVVQMVGPVAVRIGDLGKVTDSHRDQNQIVHVDGEKGVFLQVFKQPGSHTVNTVKRLRARLPQLSGLPPGIEVSVAFDQSDYIVNALRTLRHEAFFGGGLAILVVLVFLASLSGTAIVALAIPLSVVGTICVLYFTGQTLNVFTLGGLSVVIGRLVDDAIVVLENIHRHQQKGKSPLQACLDGAREVASPVFASTITTVVVFIPIVFVTGISRFLFTPLGVTFAVAMAFSYVVALTVIPVLARRFQVGHSAAAADISSSKPRLSRSQLVVTTLFDRVQVFLARVDEAYGRLIRRVLNMKAVLIVMVALLFGGSIFLTREIGTEFFPDVDEGQFKVVFRAPIGTRVEETEQLASRIEQLVREEIPRNHLRRIISSTGTRKTGLRAFLEQNTGPHTGQVLVELSPPAERRMNVEDYIQKVRKAASRRFPGIGLIFDPRGTVREVINFGYTSPIVVEQRGYDLKKASELAARTQELLKSVRHLTDVATSREDHYPNIQVDVNREQAARFGISQDDVSRVLLSSVFGNLSRAPFITDAQSGINYDIVARLAEPYRDDPNDLNEVTLQNKGKPILMRSIATVRRSTGPVDIRRRDQQRSVEATANLLSARDLGSASRAIERRLSELKVPPGFDVQLRGQTEEQREATTSLSWAFLISLSLVYMVMASQFRSLVHPFIIMFTVPLGLIGVFGALYLTHTSFSATSMMGIVMMVGIVVSNGILLVNYANVRRAEGLSPEEAAVSAGKVRLRPILMTSLATVFGLIPMAIGGPGSETYAPLARAVIGGLTVSTFLTLMFVPVLYVIVENRLRRSPPRRDDDDALLASAE